MRTLTLDHVCCTLNVALKLIVGAAWATPESNVGCINPIAWPIANESGRKREVQIYMSFQVIHVLLKILNLSTSKEINSTP
ncbi:hypothetical protein ES332_A05G392800v1 [Gossypium tomentosum]|uniref:Secreted protein n=1 Tax=Gossypium tomentosum TaxID=34277 RepID=A0A5D2QQK3_GOSTO|nr:hypothetical protein ES332_A05G392800v1 [Gossypium tomentosum]